MRRWYLAPEYMEEPEWPQRIKRCRARANRIKGKPAEIRKLVDALLVRPRDDDAFFTLLLLEERALPALLRGLEDERFHTEEARQYNGPFDELCGILDVLVPKQAGAPLVKLLKSPIVDLRFKVAIQLGKHVGAVGAGTVAKALRDREQHVREGALIGLDHALRYRVATRVAIQPLFADVLRLVDKPVVGTSHAPNMLLAIDPDRGLRALMSPARFNAAHPNIALTLIALAEARVRVDGDRILKLLADWETKRVNPYFQGYAVQLLALSGHPAAAAEVRRRLRAKDRDIRSQAAEAQKILDGVADAYHVAIDAWGGPEDDHVGVPEPIIHYATAAVLRNEVANGAFDQYFFNSYGREVRRALAGFEELGAKRSAAIVRKAIAVFGRNGPAADREERQRQLERVSARALVRLSDEFLRDPDRLDVLLARYAKKHRQHFTKDDAIT